jgi:hypothetical protein
MYPASRRTERQITEGALARDKKAFTTELISSAEPR